MTSPPSSATGLRPPSAGNSDYNAMRAVVAQVLGRTGTVCLVEVMAVTSAGEVAECIFIDVKPMQDQIDGAGNATPHGIIHDVPYFRMQGGANAVILDPVVGDIGLAVVCSRDISSAKATKKAGTPGSRRTFDLADAVYFGGLLNGIPTQYVRFAGTGIEVVSPTKVTLRAPSIELDGAVTGSSTAVFSGDVTGAGTHLHTHTHGGVTTGAGNTGAPN